MKLLYFTDPHLKGRNPARRLDDYPSEVLMFFEEVKQIAHDEDLQGVLIGGDIFDTPKISQRLYNKLARILEDFPCEIVVVPGNHDIFGMNADNLEDTMLASLEASGLIKLVSEDRGYVEFKDLYGNEVRVHGKEFTAERDHGDIDADYCIPSYELGQQWNFLMTHAMLLDKPFHPDIPHTLIKDVAPLTNADIVFGAHYHPGWDIIEENDVTFIHPGGTARLEGTKREATRMIRYALIDVDEHGGLGYELRPFKSARNGKDILDITTNAENKQHKNALDVFRKQVNDAANFESQEPDKILLGLAKANSIPKEISDMAILAILNAAKNEDELNVGLQGFVESNTNVAVEWVELEGFQAHKNTRFDFTTQGLNAIIGASDSGKTAAIRGLRWLLYNDPKGTDFIRFGESRATVRAGFSNGYIIERSRTQSSAGHYKVTDPQGGSNEYKGFAHNVPIEVTNAHQMPKTQLAKDVEVSLNIAYQLDGPFLIGESGSTRANVIGRLTGVHVVDAAIRETNKGIANYQRDIKSDLRREEELEERLTTEFTDIPDLENEVNQLELLLSRAETIESTLHELQVIDGDYKMTTDIIQDSTRELVKINAYLPKVQQALAEAETKQVIYNQLTQIQSDLEFTDNEIAGITKQLTSYRGLKRIVTELNNVEGRIKELKELRHLADSLIEADDDIEEYEQKLQGLPQISEDQIEEIAQSIARLEELKDLQFDLADNDAFIETADNALGQLDNDIATYHDEYKALLKEMGQCPTCYTPIDDAIIDRIEWT